jgi:protein-tyrosine-phosphatase
VRDWWHRRTAQRQLAACAPVTSVLVLCTANRVRSPFAERVLRARLAERQRDGSTVPMVRSRGVLPGGEGCPPEAVHAAAEQSVPLHDHLARQLSGSDLLQASVVLVMEQAMQHELVRRFPAVQRRILPLGVFDPESGWGPDIEDPIGLGREEYRVAYARIHRCCSAVAAQLTFRG